MGMEDITGQPESEENIKEALAVVSKYIVTGMSKVPIRLFILLPLICRCLKELLEFKVLIGKHRAVLQPKPSPSMEGTKKKDPDA